MLELALFVHAVSISWLVSSILNRSPSPINVVDYYNGDWAEAIEISCCLAASGNMLNTEVYLPPGCYNVNRAIVIKNIGLVSFTSCKEGGAIVNYVIGRSSPIISTLFSK